jgi:hypothetical protein
MVKRPIVNWEELSPKQASRIGQAINGLEAEADGPLRSFREETLVEELKAAGLDGVVAGSTEYTRVPREGGGWSLCRRPVAGPRSALSGVKRLDDLNPYVRDRLIEVIGNYETGRARGDELMGTIALALEIKAAGLEGVRTRNLDGSGVEYRLISSGGVVRELKRTELDAPSRPVQPAPDFNWHTFKSFHGLELGDQCVGAVYQSEPGWWIWRHGLAEDSLSLASLPDDKVTQSWRRYKSADEAMAALEAFAWAFAR